MKESNQPNKNIMYNEKTSKFLDEQQKIVSEDRKELLDNVDELIYVLQKMRDELADNTSPALCGNSAARFKDKSSDIYAQYTVLQIKQQMLKKIWQDLRKL